MTPQSPGLSHEFRNFSRLYSIQIKSTKVPKAAQHRTLSGAFRLTRSQHPLPFPQLLAEWWTAMLGRRHGWAATTNPCSLKAGTFGRPAAEYLSTDGSGRH